MAITNSYATRREMTRTSNQSKYIHGNSLGDRVYGQTAKSQKPNLPYFYYENCTLDFVHHLSRISGCGQKRRIEPPRHRSVVSSQIINNTSYPQRCLKNRNKKRTDTRTARAIKPNRVCEPVFQKEEKRGRFSNRPQTGPFWARLSKRKIKEVLRYDTDSGGSKRFGHGMKIQNSVI